MDKEWNLSQELFFVYRYLITPASLGEKTIFPLLNCFYTFAKNQMGIVVWGNSF